MPKPDGRSQSHGTARAPARAPVRVTARAPAATRVERRRAARIRRNRAMLVVAVFCSVGILAAWFPATSLLHQRSQLAAAATQLGQLNRDNAALRHQEKQLRTPATIGRIAQQQYDLVPPGEQAYQVLPASGSGGAGGMLATTGSAGPGSSPALPTQSSGTSPSAPAATSESFFGRILRTLEFWR